MRKICL